MTGRPKPDESLLATLPPFWRLTRALSHPRRPPRRTQSLVTELFPQAGKQRGAAALFRLTPQSGHETEAEVEIAFPVARHDIAEMAGSRFSSSAASCPLGSAR